MTLTDDADHLFTLATLWPTVKAAGAEFGFDPQVEAGIIFQESSFRNWRVHADGTGHGLLGLDDNGLLPDFERWSGLSIGRGQQAVSIPVVPQLRYGAYALADYARRLGGPYAAARAWHRGERLMNDLRGQQYEQLIRAHVTRLFSNGEPAVSAYNADEPTVIQSSDWDCAPSALTWALRAMGRHPAQSWIAATMIEQGYESTEQGLLDASGAGLAAFVNGEYGDGSGGPAVHALNNGSVTYDDVRSIAGQTAVLIGGRGWGGPGLGHWVGVRRYDPSLGLVLANPGGTGPIFGQQVLDRQAFSAAGPFSMVVLQADGAAPVPVPAPVDPRDARIAELEALVASLKQDLDGARVKLGVLHDQYAVTLLDVAKAIAALTPA